MNKTGFDKAFDDFLQRTEYDQAENALFSIVRIAFIAGWLASGGTPPSEQKFFTILHSLDIPPDISTDIKID